MPEGGDSRSQIRSICLENGLALQGATGWFGRSTMKEEKLSTVHQDPVVRLIDRPASGEGLRRVELAPSPTAPTRHLGVGLVWTPPGGGSPASHHHGAA